MMNRRSSCSKWLENQINLLIKNYLLLNPSKLMSLNRSILIYMKGKTVTRNILRAFEREISYSNTIDDGEPEKSLLDSMMLIEG